jgi:uncharacterized protein involved in exopolysaccharide biosynthesis
MEETRTTGERTVGAVPRDELIDMRTIMLAIRRNWILILLVSIVVLVVTAIAYYSTQPTYVATSKVMVERVPDEVVRPANPDQPVIPADSPTVDTAVAVIGSPSLLGQVVDRLKLTEHPEFNPDLANEGPRPAMASAARDRAIRILAAGLDVEREGVSYAIAINYASPDPTVAAAVANDVMAAYLDRQREGRFARRCSPRRARSPTIGRATSSSPRRRTARSPSSNCRCSTPSWRHRARRRPWPTPAGPRSRTDDRPRRSRKRSIPASSAACASSGPS